MTEQKTNNQAEQRPTDGKPTVDTGSAKDSVLVVLRGPDGKTKREVEA